MLKGYLCIVLHAHLPYKRHPEYDYFLEENWLYEAITETYIPLLDVFGKLINDGIDFRITLSLSPTLIEMFNDSLLMERYKRHIERLIELSEKESRRIKGDISFEPIVRMYNEKFRRVRYLFEDIYKRDLTCGFASDFDRSIKDAGIRFFFLEAHGVIHGIPLPRCGVYAPILCPSGAVAFGRDVESSRQVWSSIGGYPGDLYYRDFYRDIGFDLDLDYIKPYVHPDGIRTYTGLKYYRITGKTDNKKPYVIQQARKKAAEHAGNFIFNRELQLNFLSETLKIRPVITATYDAELFGHWWFEGPEWLDFLLRKIYIEHRNFRTITPLEYLSSQDCKLQGLQSCEPSMSSWGHNGYNEVWLNSSNDYVYRHLLQAADRMTYLAEKLSSAN